MPTKLLVGTTNHSVQGGAIVGGSHQVLVGGNINTMKMHLTGMENFNGKQKRTNLPMNNSQSNGAGSDSLVESRNLSQKSNLLVDVMKNNKKAAIMAAPSANAL